MRNVQIAVRVSIAAIALYAMWDSARMWDEDFIVPFTSHANMLGALIMLWGAVALVRPIPKPPAWLQGAAVLYLTITAVVYTRLIGYPEQRPPTSLFGLTNTEILHGVIPLAIALVWLGWEEHRKLRWPLVGVWISYLYIYLGIMMIRAQISPEAGYPYSFIDPGYLGAGAFVRNVVIFTILFVLCGAAIVWVDHRLPVRSSAVTQQVVAMATASAEPAREPVARYREPAATRRKPALASASR